MDPTMWIMFAASSACQNQSCDALSGHITQKHVNYDINYSYQREQRFINKFIPMYWFRLSENDKTNIYS